MCYKDVLSYKELCGAHTSGRNYKEGIIMSDKEIIHHRVANERPMAKQVVMHDRSVSRDNGLRFGTSVLYACSFTAQGM